MKRDPIFDFLFGFQTGLDPAPLQIVQRLLGTVDVPPDHPCPADVFKNLCTGFCAYTRSLGNCTVEFNHFVNEIRLLQVALDALPLTDTTPIFQLDRRKTKYAAWSLAMQIKPWHNAAQVALGGELALALLENRRIDESYCTDLARDLGKVTDPDAEEEFAPEEMAEMRFGRAWIRRFGQIDKQVRKLVELPDGDPDGTRRSYPGLALLEEIKRKIHFPSMKHRTASLNHRSLSCGQLKSVCRHVYQHVNEDDDDSTLLALEILTGCQASSVLDMPLALHRPELWVAALDVQGAALLLNLDIVFPQRKRPTNENKHLFLQAGSTLHSPIPTFLLMALIRRLAVCPDARTVVQLFPNVTASSLAKRKAIDMGEPSRIVPTAARARAAFTEVALHNKVPRSVAGPMAWDFSLMPSARMYYLRLTGEHVSKQWGPYLADMGWDIDLEKTKGLPAAGAMCCLSDEGAQSVFGHLQREVNRTPAGPNSGFERLVARHNAYACLMSCIVSWCTGLRAAGVYDVTADAWRQNRKTALVCDKAAGLRAMPKTVVLSSWILAHLGGWAEHCKSLKSRMERLSTKEPRAAAVIEYLSRVLNNEEIELFFQINSGAIEPAGSVNTWNTLPADFNVPANCGRTYWVNAFFDNGCSSSMLDTFMRHQVPGLEHDATTHSMAILDSIERLANIQDAKLSALFPSADLSGGRA